MKSYIVTGTPGSGKTTLIRLLELEGFGVVEESATDVIAAAQARGIPEPWMNASFIDDIVELQKARQLRASLFPEPFQFHDRSVVCTAALAQYMAYRMPAALERELERIAVQCVFEKHVFFVRSMGFVAPTEARRISYEDALRFEQIHEDTYRNLGFEPVFIDPGPPVRRMEAILKHMRALGR